MSRSSAFAPAGSLAVHAVVLSLLVWLGSAPPRPASSNPPVRSVLTLPPDLLRRLPLVRHAVEAAGGGSGARMPLPAAQGQLPAPSPLPLTRPLQVREVEQPQLEVPPALDIPVQPLHAVRLAQWGDPLAPAGPASNGRGRGGSIGDGDGQTVGNRRGGGYGPGDGATGIAAQAHLIGRGITAPVLIHKVEPDYSEDARRAKYQGSVTLRIVVDAAGDVRHVEVVRPLGLGLDDKAVEAVRRWRFRPGRRDGLPVPVWASVEVFFRLL